MKKNKSSSVHSANGGPQRQLVKETSGTFKCSLERSDAVLNVQMQSGGSNSPFVSLLSLTQEKERT